MANRRKKNRKPTNTAETEDRPRRCFGAYRCQQCNRRWMSANSWENYGQKCRKCNNTFVLPYLLKPLHRPDGLNKSDPKKSHPRELCQKCNDSGGFCGRSNK